LPIIFKPTRTGSPGRKHRVDLKAGVAGDYITVTILLADHGHSDPQKILGDIANQNLDTDQYAIDVKAGILNGCYSRNQFDLFLQRLLTFDDDNQDNHVSLNTAVTAQSS